MNMHMNYFELTTWQLWERGSAQTEMSSWIWTEAIAPCLVGQIFR